MGVFSQNSCLHIFSSVYSFFFYLQMRLSACYEGGKQKRHTYVKYSELTEDDK